MYICIYIYIYLYTWTLFFLPLHRFKDLSMVDLSIARTMLIVDKGRLLEQWYCSTISRNDRRRPRIFLVFKVTLFTNHFLFSFCSLIVYFNLFFFFLIVCYCCFFLSFFFVWYIWLYQRASLLQIIYYILLYIYIYIFLLIIQWFDTTTIIYSVVTDLFSISLYESHKCVINIQIHIYIHIYVDIYMYTNRGHVHIYKSINIYV